MVIKGNIRGNGGQLADYLVAIKDNDLVEILEVNGRQYADSDYLKTVIVDMELLSTLTKSDKGMYHAQINPASGEDKRTDWFKAADILGEELGFNDQPRVIVLHEKKGRAHAHVVWQRYDMATGNVIDNAYSRLAQDRARKTMEHVFAHEKTPHRNVHRAELKDVMTKLWNDTKTGTEFLKAVHDNKCMIAAGSGRNPYIVVDENGHSFNLPRYITGARLKDIRERLRKEILMGEKQAIEEMRKRKTTGNSGKGKQESETINLSTTTKEQKTAFAQNAVDMTVDAAKEREKLKQEFKETVKETTEQPRDPQKIAQEFAANRNEAVYGQTEKELRKAKLLEEQKRIEERNKKRKGKHLSIAIAFMMRLFVGSTELTEHQQSIPSIRYLWNGTALEVTQPVTKPHKNSIAYVIR